MRLIWVNRGFYDFLYYLCMKTLEISKTNKIKQINYYLLA